MAFLIDEDSNWAIDQEELKKCTFNGVLMANSCVYGFSTVFVHLYFSSTPSFSLFSFLYFCQLFDSFGVRGRSIDTVPLIFQFDE